MAQLNFVQNYNFHPTDTVGVTNGTLLFFAQNIEDSISLATINLLNRITISSLANISFTYSLGLYSMTGNTLSLANSVSLSYNSNNLIGNETINIYVSGTATSATQNITPGTWYWGIVGTSSGSVLASADYSFLGGLSANPQNAFPSFFIGGRMTDSTNNLPSSYATSDLDTTGKDAMFVPYILLSG